MHGEPPSFERTWRKYEALYLRLSKPCPVNTVKYRFTEEL